MSRSSTLILVGILVMLVSFLGFPVSMLHVALPLFGLIVAVIGFLMRADRVRAAREAMTPAMPESNGPSAIS